MTKRIKMTFKKKAAYYRAYLRWKKQGVSDVDKVSLMLNLSESMLQKIINDAEGR